MHRDVRVPRELEHISLAKIAGPYLETSWVGLKTRFRDNTSGGTTRRTVDPRYALVGGLC